MKKVKIIILFIAFCAFSMSYVDAQSKKLEITPYGFFKFDMAYDTAQTNDGNYVFYVNNNLHSNDEFNMTARQTNLGALINFEGEQGRKVSARIEVDFYGGGNENKNNPMMRHAYLKADFNKYYVIAGQTSDVISPLVPTTLNYTVLWNCGNIGYRRPQIQIGNNVAKGLEIVGALSRNISGDVDKDGNDDGEENSFPTVQIRLSYKNQNMNVGLSGHYGKMEYTNHPDSTTKADSYVSHSLNAHASYSFSPAFLLKGEFFTGKTLDQYFGGIGQGFDFKHEKEIESTGGWFTATLVPIKNISCNAGLGIDQPKKDNTVTHDRNKNMCIFGNAYAKIAQNTTLALEISRWTTDYKNTDGKNIDKSDVRVQTSLILNL